MDTSTLSADTLIPLGAAAAVVLALMVGTWKVATLLAGLNAAIAGLRVDVRRLSSKVDGHIRQRDLDTWLRLLRAKNPDLEIPEWIEAVD